MTSRNHLRAAARCWERAGFFSEAAERFTTAAAWRDAGRCFSQAERHPDAVLAYSRAGEPLLKARECLMGSWPERARSLYERLRSGPFDFPSAQVEVLLGLGELKAAIRVALSSGDHEAVAIFTRLAGTRGRPDLAAPWCPGESFALWNRSLRWLLRPPLAEKTKDWPSVEFGAVSLAPIWEEEIGGPWHGVGALHWSADGSYFAAALYHSKSLARGRVCPEGVQLERRDLPDFTYCTRFLPASHAVLAGLESGEVLLVEESGSIGVVGSLRMPGSVCSITFAPEGDRVAVSACGKNGTLLKVSSWQVGQTVDLEELRVPETNCTPLAAWSPNGRRLWWSPGPLWQRNQLFLVGQRSLDAHLRRIRSLAFTADGRFLISASQDKTVAVRDSGTGQILWYGHFADSVLGAAIHPQAALIAVGAGDRLHLIRLEPDEALQLPWLSEQKLVGGVSSLAFSPDGRHLLVLTTGYPSGHLRLFRVDLKP